MVTIQPFTSAHLPQLQTLINGHLSAAVPGWALPVDYIAQRLRHDPGQYVIDPWVVQRETLVAVENARLVAAAHLLRYGSGDEVGADYVNSCDVAWFLAYPAASDAARTLLDAALAQGRAWAARRIFAWDSGLPVPALVGVADAWPHVATALSDAGFRPTFARAEALYGGYLPGAESERPESLEVAQDVTIGREIGLTDACFRAVWRGQSIGHCECRSALSHGGDLPALQGWAELAELEVTEAWRNRGVGTRLVQRAVEWLRLSGCTRIILSVAQADEEAGAGRFYRRFNWDVLTRERDGWALAPNLQS